MSGTQRMGCDTKPSKTYKTTASVPDFWYCVGSPLYVYSVKRALDTEEAVHFFKKGHKVANLVDFCDSF